MSKVQLLTNAKTGEIVGFIARDGKQYPLQDNLANIVLDAPNDTHPYSVIYMQNGKIVDRFCTDKNFLIGMKADGVTIDRAIVNEDGNLEFLN